MQAIIVAGGYGSRMGELYKDVPKSMLLINKKPLLEHQILQLRKFGIIDITILLHFQAKKIKEYFKTGINWGVNLKYCLERTPLGTAGALKHAKPLLEKEDFLVIYGDKMFNLNLTKLAECHKKKGGIATIVVHPTTHLKDSDLFELDEENRIIEVHSKPHDRDYHNIANASIYVLSPKVLEYIQKGVKLDFAHDVLPMLASMNRYFPKEKEQTFAYPTHEYIKDIGTPERYAEIQKDFDEGKAKTKKKAIFLDRDGTLTKSIDADGEASIELFDFSAEAVKKINQSEYLAVLTTNQPNIAKGLKTEQELEKEFCKLENMLGKKGAYLDKIYYCPHHPEKGFKGEIEKYKIECNCRKPKSGMLEKAAKELNIDLSESYVVGDMTADILAGKNAFECRGVKETICVKTGWGCYDYKWNVAPDMMFENLLDAVDYIIKEAER